MRLTTFSLLLFTAIQLLNSSCGSQAKIGANQVLAAPDRENSVTAPAFRDTLVTLLLRGDTTSKYAALLDTTDILPLLEESTLMAFRQAQPLPFVESTDTLIDDERGVAVGKKLRLDRSYISWLDGTHIGRAEVSDKRIRLTHGIRVGMTRQEVAQRLGITPLLSDTLVVETGYMLNHCTFFFWQGRLHTVCLSNMPD